MISLSNIQPTETLPAISYSPLVFREKRCLSRSCIGPASYVQNSGFIITSYQFCRWKRKLDRQSSVLDSMSLWQLRFSWLSNLSFQFSSWSEYLFGFYARVSMSLDKARITLTASAIFKLYNSLHGKIALTASAIFKLYNSLHGKIAMHGRGKIAAYDKSTCLGKCFRTYSGKITSSLQ